MRDNVIKYNDEGGGEQDTQAYDMSALRNLYDFPEAKSCDSGPDIRSLPQWIQANRVTGGGGGAGAEGTAATAAAVAADFSLFKGYIRKKVEQADADLSVPPYDSFQTYAFEGASSPALSLSSIHTLSTTSEQDFSYLSDWGPRFRQLAGYYTPGKQEEEGSQHSLSSSQTLEPPSSSSLSSSSYPLACCIISVSEGQSTSLPPPC